MAAEKTKNESSEGLHQGEILSTALGAAASDKFIGQRAVLRQNSVRPEMIDFSWLTRLHNG
jgi:hypothetical protein